MMLEEYLMRTLLGIKTCLALAAVAALSLGSGPALGHEGREMGEFRFTVGFTSEPAYEGIKNGVDLRVVRISSGDVHSHDPNGEATGHGVLFEQALEPGQSFDYQVPGHLVGTTLPYHSHNTPDVKGNITVSDSAGALEEAQIELTPDGVIPDDLTVRPGATVSFINNSGGVHVITSGLHPGSDHSHEDETVPVEGLQNSLQVEVTHVGSGTSRVFPLRTVFREPGRYTADLIPTAPGVYQMRFFGTVEGVEVDETFVSYGGGGGFNDVQSSADLQFPDPVPQARELEGAARGAQSAAQEAQLAAQRADDSASSAATLGMVGIVLGALGLVSGVGGLALAMRKR
jgi:plastocyanin